MSRFLLLGAHEAVVDGIRQRLRGGQIISDTIGNAQRGNLNAPNDLVCPTLAAQPTDRMVPLDQAAVNAMFAVRLIPDASPSRIGQALTGTSTGAASCGGADKAVDPQWRR